MTTLLLKRIKLIYNKVYIKDYSNRNIDFFRRLVRNFLATRVSKNHFAKEFIT